MEFAGLFVSEFLPQIAHNRWVCVFKIRELVIIQWSQMIACDNRGIKTLDTNHVIPVTRFDTSVIRFTQRSGEIILSFTKRTSLINHVTYQMNPRIKARGLRHKGWGRESDMTTATRFE